MKPDKTHWNLTGLLVWIMHRDQIFADGEADYRDSAVELGLITSNWLTGLDCVMDFEQAVSEALNALVFGKLKAFASLNNADGRVSIPPEGWVGRKFQYSPDIAVEELTTGVSCSRYENLLFSVEDAVLVWPPRPSTQPKIKNSRSQNEKRKAQTQSKYIRWRKRADALRQEFPGKSNRWYARKISKEDIAEGAADSYIRKQIGGNMVKKT